METATLVSTTTFEHLLYTTISSSNALPIRRVKKHMDGLVEHELRYKVQWEERTDGKSIMEIIIPTSKFNTGDLEEITYKINSANGTPLVEGAAVFDSSTGWQLDKYMKARTGRSTRSKGWRKQKQKQKPKQTQTQRRKQTQKQVVTDTDEGSQSSEFPPSSLAGNMDDMEYQPGNVKISLKLTTEGKWTSLFNAILGVMHKRLKRMVQSTSSSSCPASDIFPFPCGNQIPHRYWSAKFANIPVPDETNAQKPDIVLLSEEIMLLPPQEITWADVLTGVEITDQHFSKDASAYLGVATKAYLMAREQPWRRFVVLFSIAARNLHCHYFDRSGLIITSPIQINKNPVRLADMLNTMTLGNREVLGFDPTMHMCTKSCTDTHKYLKAGAIGWIKRDTRVTYSIMEILWRSQGFFSRGTTCYRVQDDSGAEYALKDCWVEEDKKRHEVDILKMVAGTPNVVTLVDEWDVMYNGKPDSTWNIRQHGGSPPAGHSNRCHQ